MIDVAIYDNGDFVIRNIGEELIRENHKNINFYFISEFGLEKNNYTILSERNKLHIKNSKMILLTQEKSKEGIFLYQSKARIKTEILNIVGEEIGRPRMEIVAAISPYNLYAATISSHFIARELSNNDKKVCMLSFNIDFPFHTIGWDRGKKGLLKAIYYYSNSEEFNPGFINQNSRNQYHYIEMDIKKEEIYQITDIFLDSLMKFFETQSYRYVVLDYGILYWQLKHIIDYLYFIQIESSSLEMDMNKKHLIGINNLSNFENIILGQIDKIFSVKNGEIKFNKDREELILWKRNLKMKLLKN